MSCVSDLANSSAFVVSHRGTRFAATASVIREVGVSRAAAATVTNADELFVNLDGSVIETTNGKWCIEVCGIHSHDEGNWVQLCLRSDESYGLTVSVDRLSATQIRSVVSDWLSSAAATALR